MLRHALKKLYYTSMSAVSADARMIRKIRRAGKVSILNLHRVSEERNSYWPPLRPQIFDELLRFLRSNFEICRLAELEGVKSSKPVAVLSFDDGYYDFIEYALPLLKRYRVPANMNIIPQCAITGKPIWNVQLYDFLDAAPRQLINEIEIPGFNDRLESESASAKLKFGLQLSSYLKNRPSTERQEIWRSIEQHIRRLGKASTRMMTTVEIREITSEVEIGSHSFSHESMGFEDNEFFEDDFEKCRNFFGSELGAPLSIYAFPNGSYRPEQIEFLRRNSIKHILLVDEKFSDPRSDVLTRFTIYGENSKEAKMRALGF